MVDQRRLSRSPSFPARCRFIAANKQGTNVGTAIGRFKHHEAGLIPQAVLAAIDPNGK